MMAVTPELVEELIRAGKLTLGMTRKEMIRTLGEPEEYGGISNKFKYPSIYKYGVIQMVFPPCRNQEESEHNGLEYIYIDDSGSEEPVFLLR